VASFSRSTFGFGLLNLPSFISIFGSSSQLVTSSPHGLHGLTKAIDASNLGASNFAKLSTLDVTSFVGTFGLFFFFLGRERISTSSNGAFATTFVTHGLIFGESIKKKGKKGEILKRCQKTMGCPISLG
jgi:hypothetical protein